MFEGRRSGRRTYLQACFEGLKRHVSKKGKINARAQKNYECKLIYQRSVEISSR